MKEMTAHCNLYANSHGAVEERRHREPVRVSDLICWIGILIYIVVCCMPAVEDDWKHEGLYLTHHICYYMSLTRYEQMRCYFHLVHPDGLRRLVDIAYGMPKLTQY